MADLIGGEIPIIGEKKKSVQQLIIIFEEKENDDGSIRIGFAPEIPNEPETPEQRAALETANLIINHFNKDITEEKQNARTTDKLQ